MKTTRRTLTFGSLLVALLFFLLPHLGQSQGRLSEKGRLSDTETVTQSASTLDQESDGKSHTCVLDQPVNTQPFILQQNSTLHLGGGEARQHTPAPEGLQERHIKLYECSYKILHTEQTTRQSLLHTRGYFFYALCQMLM